MQGVWHTAVSYAGGTDVGTESRSVHRLEDKNRGFKELTDRHGDIDYILPNIREGPGRGLGEGKFPCKLPTTPAKYQITK